MQKVAGFTSAHTKHTHTPTTLTHIREKCSLPMNKSSANWTNFLLTAKEKKKQMREGKEGWGRQYNRHTQLGNPNWNLTNCCLRMATSKLVSVQVNQRVQRVTHPTYYIICDIYNYTVLVKLLTVIHFAILIMFNTKTNWNHNELPQII